MIPEQRWDGALCREIGGDIWFPERGDSADDAKRICASCPLQQQCLDYALSIETEEFALEGIWGGLAPRQRRKLRSTPGRNGVRNPKPCGTDAAHRRHQRRGETPCEACVRAHRQRSAERKVRRGAAA